MAESAPSLLNRIFLALTTFWRLLVDPQFASEVARLRDQGPATEPEVPPPVPSPLREAEPNAALQLLGLLQQEGRFIDFLEEEVATYADAEVGAAARIVHEGCKKTMRQHFSIEAVRSEPEGARLTLEEGFDAGAIRLTGNVVGQAPFRGCMTHRGWRVAATSLPQVAAGHDLSILAPAEVEL